MHATVVTYQVLNVVVHFNSLFVFTAVPLQKLYSSELRYNNSFKIGIVCEIISPSYRKCVWNCVVIMFV